VAIEEHAKIFPQCPAIERMEAQFRVLGNAGKVVIKKLVTDSVGRCLGTRHREYLLEIVVAWRLARSTAT
jgi:hypothetical protein